jgi:hypothetical protein
MSNSLENETMLTPLNKTHYATADHIYAASITALKNQLTQSVPRTALSKI